MQNLHKEKNSGPISVLPMPYPRVYKATGDEPSYYDLVQNVNSIILVLDPQGKVRFANQFACDFFGYAPHELEGHSVFETIVPQYDQAGDKLAEQLSRELQHPEQIASNVNENILCDGTRVWIAWRNQAIRDQNGDVVEILAVGNDITNRKMEDEAIRRSEGTLRQTINSTMHPVLVTELGSGRLVEVNRQFESILGYSPTEVTNLKLTDLICETDQCTHRKIHHALDRSIPAKYAVVDDRELFSVFECLCKRKNGETYWAEITINYLDQEPHPRNLCIIYDISERKKSEEWLRLQRNRLIELLQTQERERSLIAYEIHDSPAQHLAAAAMQLDICLEMLDKDQEAARQALTEGRTMVNQTLAEIRRLIAGFCPPQLEDVGIVNAIRTLVQKSQKPPKIQLECDIQFERLEPLAENSLFRIVQESVNNAIRYSQSETVTIRLTQSRGRIRIEIQDEGIGFLPEEVKNNRFGLNGIRQRAIDLGGHAVIRSAPGHGTRVTVELPVSLIVKENQGKHSGP